MRRAVSVFLWVAGLVFALQLQLWASWEAFSPVLRAGVLAGHTVMRPSLVQTLKDLGTSVRPQLDRNAVPALPSPWKRILRTFANSA